MAHFAPHAPLYITPGGHLTDDPSKRQLGSKVVGTYIPPPIPGRSYLCDGPVKAGEMVYLIADDRVSAEPPVHPSPRVYVESTNISTNRGVIERTATIVDPADLDYTRGPLFRSPPVDIHTIACDDAPKEVDPRRWRAVVDTVMADNSEKTPTSRMLARNRRTNPERDIAHDMATVAPVVAAYAVARFVWGYDIVTATADALARCKREDDPALTRYLVAYERA